MMNNAEHAHYIEKHGDSIATKLLEWYHQNKRDLHWRRNHNPYSIWISEVMLQQTGVSTVINYYMHFMETFPTIQDLAEADEDKLLKVWEGLGYYSRAKRLKQAAMVIMEQYDGHFPSTYAEVLKLPGIGPYTAGAILSIAHNLAVPAVDGNVLRVFARLFNDQRDISDLRTRKSFEVMATALLPDDCRHYNQSLMELGATVCTPRNPKCESCPIDTLCISKANNCQSDLPIKKKKKKNKQLNMEVALLHYQQYMLIIKRPSEGLLADLWGFPITPRNESMKEGMSIEEELEEFLGIPVQLVKSIKKAKHVFSHRTWHMTLYEFRIEKMVTPDHPQVRWIELDKMVDYPLPTAFKKLITQ